MPLFYVQTCFFFIFKINYYVNLFKETVSQMTNWRKW